MKRWLAAIVLALASLGSVWAQNVHTYIPPQAFTFKDTISYELTSHFQELHEPNYVPALIEHESCRSLKHSRCWKSTAQLKTQRELGVGLGQITKAYHPDGSLRFDSLTEMRSRYKLELKEASWETIAHRSDIQIRLIVLMLRDSWKRLYEVDDLDARMAFMDAAYNGGLGGVNKERRVCRLTKGCDPNQWYGHVENICLKSKKPLYGQRSVCDTYKHHTRDVLGVRLPKYQKQYFVD